MDRFVVKRFHSIEAPLQFAMFFYS